MKNRSGSYKKVLFDPRELGQYQDYAFSAISDLLNSNLKDYDLCALYIILFLRLRHKKNWLQRKSSSPPSLFGSKILDIIPNSFNLNEWEKEKLKDLTTYDLFANYNLRGIPQAINKSLCEWSYGNWDIILLDFIPSSKRLLGYQAKNKRCVTIITKKDELANLVLEARDPLSFVLHDLDHADHFFNNREILDGQLGFYSKTLEIYDLPILEENRKLNSKFEHDFNYVVSDMNAYVVHLAKCLKASFTNHHVDGYETIIKHWNCDSDLYQAFQKLNTPEFTYEDEALIKNFFELNSIRKL